ncbi:hypothetical protein [Halalkalibacter alkalisediminis]|uniref:Uncharacterized protein n=1 Tax=Halalkalibacter alkalisediminis TaxID=935616 RepID=A0ABV6NMQ9_9BACI|nr:hypothetical protein [Halalkalibacter alkalisediminis]
MKEHQPIIVNRPVKKASKASKVLPGNQTVTNSQLGQKVKRGGCCLRGKV